MTKSEKLHVLYMLEKYLLTEENKRDQHEPGTDQYKSFSDAAAKLREAIKNIEGIETV